MHYRYWYWYPYCSYMMTTIFVWWLGFYNDSHLRTAGISYLHITCTICIFYQLTVYSYYLFLYPCSMSWPPLRYSLYSCRDHYCLYYSFSDYCLYDDDYDLTMTIEDGHMIPRWFTNPADCSRWAGRADCLRCLHVGSTLQWTRQSLFLDLSGSPSGCSVYNYHPIHHFIYYDLVYYFYSLMYCYIYYYHPILYYLSQFCWCGFEYVNRVNG